MPAKILVVEDDESLLKLEMILLTARGYLTHGVMTGVDALSAISVEAPDLVLLDIMLPQLDGFQVCQQIKRDLATRHIPVIFLSGKNTPEDISHGERVGGDRFISKPFKATTMLNTIKLLLETNEWQSGDKTPLAQ